MNGISVIIAAHNEAGVIESALRSILANKVDRALQIIVVANGCTDDTAARARAMGDAVQVIETPVGNKIEALNLGDAAATYFPRAYLDADIELSDNALQSVIDLFESDPHCRVAAPKPRHVYRGHNPFLAGYYALWRSMPYVRNAIMGGGFYAIDQEMRARFEKFPAITGDDKFIRNMAKPEERRVAESAWAMVHMPNTLSDLLRVKTRWTYGNMELSLLYPQLQENDGPHYKGALRSVLLRPWLWIHIPLFMFVFLYTRRAARKRFAERKSSWDRDQSTRPQQDSAQDPGDDARRQPRPAA